MKHCRKCAIYVVGNFEQPNFMILSQNHLIGKNFVFSVNQYFTNGKKNQFYCFTEVKIARLSHAVQKWCRGINMHFHWLLDLLSRTESSNILEVRHVGQTSTIVCMQSHSVLLRHEVRACTYQSIRPNLISRDWADNMQVCEVYYILSAPDLAQLRNTKLAMADGKPCLALKAQRRSRLCAIVSSALTELLQPSAQETMETGQLMVSLTD